MVLRLDVAIDKVEDLSRDVELDRMEKKQVDKSENVTDRYSGGDYFCNVCGRTFGVSVWSGSI